MVNYGRAASTPVTVSIPGAKGDAKLTTLTTLDLYSTNTLGNTSSIWTETMVLIENGVYSFTLTGEYDNAVLVAST